MIDKIFSWLILATPAAILVHEFDMPALSVFILSAVAIVPLAKFLGEATEELATHSGPAVGGLLNTTFGNATELIIGIFALRAGLLEVVRASVTGSIMGNLLLVLGMAIFIGGLKHKRQTFNRTPALAGSSMLVLAVIALVIPAIFAHSSGNISAVTNHQLSALVSVLMLVLYAAYIIFIFFTHKHLYTEDVGKYEAKWSIKKSVAIMLLATVAIAWLSEILVGAISPTIDHLGWTQLFVGAVIVAIIGNAAEHTSAVVMAAKNRMELCLQIAIGSATQIAMFVMPVLVLLSRLTPHPLDLTFNTFELAAIILSVVIANLVVEDGETNWLEGAQLFTAYVVIAVAFYFFP
ncbi:MAG TPA: calcium/proton exchanger [Candidatus Saccharimonadales bacterium]|nr:calcium/proton exchanger [Candidatus Saccharimonadales bacterium]